MTHSIHFRLTPEMGVSGLPSKMLSSGVEISGFRVFGAGGEVERFEGLELAPEPPLSKICGNKSF
jgi:hypothetical protein